MSEVITIPAATQWREPKELSITDDTLKISVGQDSQATIILTITGEVTVTATLEQNAVLTVICVQLVEATLVQRATVGDGATINWQNVSLASGKSDLQSRLTGEHATSNVDWLLYANGQEQADIKAENSFAAVSGGGEITLRAVAQDEATVDCQGMITIDLNGGGTDTYLTEEVLMLDPTAKVNAVPGLEIKTNDVKASHSATVSRVTQEDLLYFGARGLDPATARHLYVLGFLGDLTQKMPERIQGEVVEAIEKKFRVKNE